VKLVCEVLSVSRSNVSARLSRPATRRDGGQSKESDDMTLVEEIRRVVGDLPSYGYCQVWGKLSNERVAAGQTPFKAKRRHRVMRTHGLLMQRRLIPPRPQRQHDGNVAVARSNQRWCSDGFGFRCDNG
jgi:putative transposase